jgi:hypothetical protein
VPITLRWLRLVVVPTTGPRSAGVAAPQLMGSAPCRPACEVRRMWRGAETSDGMAGPLKKDTLSKTVPGMKRLCEPPPPLVKISGRPFPSCRRALRAAHRPAFRTFVRISQDSASSRAGRPLCSPCANTSAPTPPAPATSSRWPAGARRPLADGPRSAAARQLSHGQARVPFAIDAMVVLPTTCMRSGRCRLVRRGGGLAVFEHSSLSCARASCIGADWGLASGGGGEVR